MNARNWLLTTLAVTAALVACCVAVNATVDPFGIFRDPTGRKLAGYGDDRLAKYLLNGRYVPANFDSLLIGPSVSGNWPVADIKILSIYNDSLNGGDITELKSLVDRSMKSWRPKVALLIVTPYLTMSHEFKTVPMTPSLRLRALGSFNLIYAYKEWMLYELGRATRSFDAVGSEDFGNQPQPLNANLRGLLDPAKPGFDIDPDAMQAYRGLITELQARGVPIVFIIPPMADELYRPKQEAFRTYARMLLRMGTERDRVIDFTSEELTGHPWNQAGGFMDGVHLRQSAAAELTGAVAERLQRWSQQAGWLR